MQDTVTDLISHYTSLLIQEQYVELTEHCEQMITQDPSTATSYWFLGLVQLLQGQEEDAQIAWMTPLLAADSEQAERWTDDLINILDAEATRQEAQSADAHAWLIRQHMRELAPMHLDNLLQLVVLNIKIDAFSYEEDLFPQIIHVLQSDRRLTCDRLLHVIQYLLAFNPEHVAFFDFLEVCTPHFATAQRLPELVHFLLQQPKNVVKPLVILRRFIWQNYVLNLHPMTAMSCCRWYRSCKATLTVWLRACPLQSI